MITTPDDHASAAPPRTWRRILPLAVLLIGTGAFFAAGLHDRASCAWLADHRDALTVFIDAHRLTAVLAYMAIYALAAACSLPVAMILTLTGGFLFGLWSTVYVVIAATLGATMLFLAARSALGEVLRGRAAPAIARMDRGFRDNAMSYLLFLRLAPMFPFWLVNLVPAIVGIPLRTFVIGTAIGILPVTFIFTGVGSSLHALFESGQPCDPRALTSARVILPLIGLALLSLVPILYKKWRGRRGEDGNEHD